jgi:hypothetical protein
MKSGTIVFGFLSILFFTTDVLPQSLKDTDDYFYFVNFGWLVKNSHCRGNVVGCRIDVGRA